MRRKRRWRNVLYFLAGLFIAYWVGCYYLAVKYVHPSVRNESGPPPGFQVFKQAWSSTNIDTAKAVFVLVHGYGGNQSRWTDMATRLVKDGYGVVIPALPGHDDLAKETCGFGLKEADRVVTVVKEVRDLHHGNKPKIVLVGISMGGAACWLASEKDPSIDAVVSEGCFARLGPATDSWFNRKMPGASLLLRPVIWFASSMSGVSPGDVNPVEAAAKWKGKPALVIHGSEDELFPVQNAHDLANASGAELWIVPDATHAHCSDLASDEYLKRIEAFAH